MNGTEWKPQHAKHSVCRFRTHRTGAMPRGAFPLWFTREGSCWWNPWSLPVITFAAGCLQLFLHFVGHRVIFLMVVQCHVEPVRRVVFTFTLLHYRKHSSQKTQLFAKMPHSFFFCWGGGKSCSQLFLQLRLVQSFYSIYVNLKVFQWLTGMVKLLLLWFFFSPSPPQWLMHEGYRKACEG